MPPGCCSSSRRLESSQLAGTAAGHAGGLRHCSAGTLAGGGECILGEWMVSGLLALLGGPLLFVCPRQALSRGACTYPARQCPVGEPGSAGSFPTAWRCPLTFSPSGQILSKAAKSCLARRKLRGLHSQLRLFVSPEMPSETL